METNAADEHAAIIAPVAAENLAKPSKPSATTKVWTAQMKVYSTRRYLEGGVMRRESESRRQERSREVVRSTRADADARATQHALSAHALHGVLDRVGPAAQREPHREERGEPE